MIASGPRIHVYIFKLACLVTTLAIIALLAVSALASATPDELLTNPGFEDGTTGWSSLAGTLIQVDSPIRSGSTGNHAVSFTCSTTEKFSQLVQVQQGETYTLSGYAYKNNPAVEVGLYLKNTVV